MAASVQVGSLLPGAMPPVSEAFKGSKDAKTIVNLFISISCILALCQYLIGLCKSYSQLSCYRDLYIAGLLPSYIYWIEKVLLG